VFFLSWLKGGLGGCGTGARGAGLGVGGQQESACVCAVFFLPFLRQLLGFFLLLQQFACEVSEGAHSAKLLRRADYSLQLLGWGRYIPFLWN
jgi:hypothetical protein